MYRAGGSTVAFGRLKTVPPVAFNRADFQPAEGEMDVSRGDVFSGAAGLPGGGDERSGSARVFGLHRDTVRKMLANATPPGYTRKRPHRKPKIEPYTGVIDAILEADSRVPRKQRHTVKRIFERLRDEYGFDGQQTIVKDYVRERRQHVRELKLPTFLREYGKLAARCAAEGADHLDYLLRLAELELTDRHQRMVERRIRAARFPATKGLDTFDFSAIPSVNKPLVMQLARCEYVDHHENVIAIGNSGTGKTHVALGLGLAACQRGLSVGFTTAAALVHELMEARDERRLLNLQRQLAWHQLLIIDELGFVPRSPTGAELLFEVFSQCYERGSTLVTTNLPFDEWTEVFGSERLTGALLDRLTHHVHILEMNGESYRLKGSRQDAPASSPSPSARTPISAPRTPTPAPPSRRDPPPTGQAAAVRHHPSGTAFHRPSGTVFVRP